VGTGKNRRDLSGSDRDTELYERAMASRAKVAQADRGQSAGELGHLFPGRGRATGGDFSGRT
jgi:hypothetical protein